MRRSFAKATRGWELGWESLRLRNCIGVDRRHSGELWRRRNRVCGEWGRMGGQSSSLDVQSVTDLYIKSMESKMHRGHAASIPWTAYSSPLSEFWKSTFLRWTSAQTFSRAEEEPNMNKAPTGSHVALLKPPPPADATTLPQCHRPPSKTPS